ncbi:peptide-methionine (R)-S-oxide reductase MsrB [Sphingomonas sp.]|uniref:peptide-methionine (R)-S-oxide reductase MsrB n=1 Tax=Sphingomonas sp. TaxID=28214 RepID=UPI00375022F9
MNNLTRRNLITRGTAVTGALLFAGCSQSPAAAAAAAGPFEVRKTEAEWRHQLGPARYNILREGGTELPYTSPLLKEHRRGTFVCAGCALPLYSSTTKFDSGTGWPSFWQPLPRAVAESRDSTLGIVRREIHCRRCGGHLGHVFDDGPKPTGLRYCMDGLALAFHPA